MNLAHFWTLRDCTGIDLWDPDAEPSLHQSGYGHSFLELYVRLRRAGHQVSIGSEIPVDRAAVVVCLEELSGWKRHGAPSKTIRLCWRLLRRKVPLVVIRNDVHPHIRAPYCASLEFLPTTASVQHPDRQCVLPLLPQRGLRPRSDSRLSHIEFVGLKTYSQNVPDWVPELERLLAPHGVGVRVDTEEGDSHDWADFVELDSVLCFQPSATLGDARRKPATKLINAWAAGVIPICEPHTAYTEIAEPGRDSLFATTPEAIVGWVARLNQDHELASALFAGAQRRGAEFSTSLILARWADALTGLKPVTRRRVLTEIAICLTQLGLGPRASQRLVTVIQARHDSHR